MEGEPDLPNLPAQSKFLKPNFSRSITIRPPESINLSRTFNTTFSSTSSSSSSAYSPPEILRDAQAFLKRNYPNGMKQSNGVQPRRFVVPRREISKGADNLKLYNAQRDQNGLPSRFESNNEVVSLLSGPQTVQVEEPKKVHFATDNHATAHENEWDAANQVDDSAAVKQDWQDHDFQSMEVAHSSRPEGGISSMFTSRTIDGQDVGNFVHDGLSNAITQSSVVGPSCVTSTLIHPTSAPMLSSTTFCSQRQSNDAYIGKNPVGVSEPQHDVVQSLNPPTNGDRALSHHLAVTSQAIPSASAIPVTVNKSSGTSNVLQSNSPQECGISKDSTRDGILIQENVSDIKDQPPSQKVPLSGVKLETSKSDKQGEAKGKAASTSRKRDYNPDLYFRVNGKFYQRLGKIGSGGSSEVHKVISSDCNIYALKKIKLKGRDYATAYGFCQEMEYLNKLRGKDHIIQLIDYEVTDKTLLHEVMNGSMSNMDGRVKDDGFIYMVLEYGEIDLANMLAQKWKELDGTNTIIDENWLRFYWQQILLAVNTIHEERIVHSDLKPANFLLVKGSLKLIDFGIAKAILNDTTNIQRDSQAGTLSYMSPEAFLCNESDADGNTIKCGRPSDIWSLGCILYQMVYGRTPFSGYKTFWAKFKVITDPNHEIVYEQVSNPMLLDLMKKCLAWDRKERWRIPQLLQHPFLVPPVPPQLPSSADQSCALFQQIAELSGKDDKVLMQCSELQNMINDPRSVVGFETSISRDQARKLLCKISTLCFHLQGQLANSKETNI